MFVRKLFQISSRLPDRLQWRVQSVSYCGRPDDKQSNSSNGTQQRNVTDNLSPSENIPGSHVSSAGDGTYNSMRAIIVKEAEEFLANLDSEGLKKMEEIKELMETLRLENKRVPEKIPVTEWKRLICELNSYSSRSKFLAKLFLDEVKNKNVVIKKREKMREREIRSEMKKNEGFPQFSVHIPNRDKDTKRWNGIQALQSDTNIVFDLDYEQNTREHVAVFDQIQMLWSQNLRHRQPLNIHLTSINRNERLRALFQTNSTVFVNAHEAHFTDVFQHEDLVYLSPDGPQLKHFDVNCTYIVGGIADMGGRSRLSFGKARKLGIKTASLPIKHYCDLSIRCPQTVLTLNCMFGILQDMYLHHSWKTAFRNNLKSAFVLYEDSMSDAYAQKRNNMIEKRMLRSFKRNQSFLEIP